MYYVYILKSIEKDKIYIGSTNNLVRRLKERNQGDNFFTKIYRPWELIYYEAFNIEKLARMREQKLKQHGNAFRALKKRIGIKSGAGFTLVEVLLIVSIFIILLSSAVALSGSRLQKEDLNAKSREIVDIISRARNNSMTGYQGDVWGIKVLNDSADCPGNADCIVMYKGTQYSERVSSYDQFVSLGISTSTTAYIESDQSNEFYFSYLSGWLSTTTGALAEQGILLNSYTGNQKVVTTTPTGVVYFDDP